MAGERVFFDELAGPGDGIFEFLEGSPRAKYLRLVEQIYRILADLHDRVATVVVEVGEATSEEDAAIILQALDADNLRDQLKAQKLCDRLEKLGIQLRDVLPKTIPSGPEAETLGQLSTELEGREQRTADMYADRLWDLRSLAWPGSAASVPLSDIKAKADDIAKELLLQKAGFDLMRKKAHEKSRRI
jgi:hypothetical protein